jgi:hypothetical protein
VNFALVTISGAYQVAQPGYLQSAYTSVPGWYPCAGYLLDPPGNWVPAGDAVSASLPCQPEDS